jgi:hypothetical protein
MVGKPFPDDASDDALSALHVADPERHAIIVPEIELADIAAKMLRRDVLVRAIKARFRMLK